MLLVKDGASAPTAVCYIIGTKLGSVDSHFSVHYYCVTYKHGQSITRWLFNNAISLESTNTEYIEVE